MNDYSIFESSGTMLFQWMTPSLPGEIRALCVGLLALSPFLFLFRGALAPFARKHLHLGFVSPDRLAWAAPALSLIAALGLWLGRPSPPMIQWRLGPASFELKSANGVAAMRWDEVERVRFDERSPTPEKAAMILTSKSGKEAWFVLSWLRPEHREKLILEVNARAPGRLGKPR